MGTITLRLPQSLHDKVRELSERDGMSINQFATTAITEKLAALLTQDYLEQRAKRGSRQKFASALSKVGGSQPMPGDELE
jgi:hypothetical protein